MCMHTNVHFPVETVKNCQSLAVKLPSRGLRLLTHCTGTEELRSTVAMLGSHTQCVTHIVYKTEHILKMEQIGQGDCSSVISLKLMARNFMVIINEEQRNVTMSSFCIAFSLFAIFAQSLFQLLSLTPSLSGLRMRCGCQCRLSSVFYHLIKHAGAAGL